MHSNRLTSAIFQNLYAGVSVNDTIKVLEGIPLAGFQLETLTYTGIKTFDDAARYKVFEGLNVKWTYFGPLDDRTRDSCRKTKEKEPEGWKTSYDNQSINRMINISSTQVYESHRQPIPIVGRDRNKIFKQLKQDNITILSPPIRASYNSPFTLPMLKRNEVMYRIDL